MAAKIMITITFNESFLCDWLTVVLLYRFPKDTAIRKQWKDALWKEMSSKDELFSTVFV